MSFGVNDNYKESARSTYKLAPIRNVFESMINRFQMAYTPNVHITILEELVVLREKCPFYLFIK